MFSFLSIGPGVIYPDEILYHHLRLFVFSEILVLLTNEEEGEEEEFLILEFQLKEHSTNLTFCLLFALKPFWLHLAPFSTQRLSQRLSPEKTLEIPFFSKKRPI